MGVIDTIGAGFRLVLRKPWLALIPVLLDLFLWLGPKLSMAPVVDSTLAVLRDFGAGVAQSAGSAAVDQVNNLARVLQESVRNSNVFALLVWGNLGMPGVAGGVPIEAGAQAIQVTNLWVLVLLQVLILAAGLLVTAAFLVLLGYAVREEPVAPASLLSEVGRAWVRLSTVIVPLAIGILSVALASAVLGPLAVLPLVGMLLVLLYVTFFPQGVALAGQRPWGAVVSSFFIVRTNLWSTLGLLLLSNVLSTGLGLLWGRLVGANAVGMVVAIVASALVGTSLTAAMFFFYRDRLIVLQGIISAGRSA